MQFLADVMIRCPECRGTRYRPEILEVTYRGKNIAEVLDLTAREAFALLPAPAEGAGAAPPAAGRRARLPAARPARLDPLRRRGPAAEARRASSPTSPGAMTRAARPARRPCSSSTSRRPACTRPTPLKLLDALNSLLDLGHSLIVVEHSPEIMAARRLDHRPRPRAPATTAAGSSPRGRPRRSPNPGRTPGRS